MKIMARKALSILLVVAMVLSFGVTAFAAEDVEAFGGDLVITVGNGWTCNNSDNTDWSINQLSKKSSLQLTNNSEKARDLVIQYEVTSGSFTHGSDTLDDSGSYTIEIQPQGTETLTASKNASISLTFLSFNEKAVGVTVTFEPVENGSYTVNGETITAGTPFTVSSDAEFALAAAPNEGYTFVGWYDAAGVCLSSESNVTLSFDADTVVKPRFAEATSVEDGIFAVGSVLFTTFEKAKDYALANGEDTVVLVQNFTLTEDLVIPEGLTLLIPYNDEHTCFKGEVAGPSLESNDPRINQTYTTPTVYRQLTVAQGVTLTVNGELSISAQHTAPAGSTGAAFGPTGPCGFLTLEPGSNVVVNGGLYAFGFVTGSGAVTANSGAQVFELMQVADFRGGTVTVAKMATNEQKVFPFSQYYIQNIETPLTLNAGAREYVVASLYAMGLAISAKIEFIGPDGMFQVESGSVTKRYLPGTDRMEIEVNGQGSIRHLVLGMDVTAILPQMGVVSVDSANFVLPITNNMSILVASGTTVLDQDMAFLAGTKVTIAEGATTEIASGRSIYVYDRDEWMGGDYVFSSNKHFAPVYYSPTRSYNRTLNDLTDAVIDVNGTLIVDGGFYTTAGGAEVISSGETGNVIFSSGAGKETVTYQAVQNGSDVTYPEIPITSAKLKNNTPDEPFAETKNAAANTTYFWSADEQKWMSGFTVSFDPNGGEGEMEPLFIQTDDEDVSLPANTFTRDGYAFAGWAYDPDERPDYIDYEDEDLLDEDASVTLYAIWEEQPEIVVTFILNGGTFQGNVPGNPSSDLTIEGMDPGTQITLYNAAKRGHTLQWRDNKGNLYSAGDRYTVNSSVTFNAVWTPETYTVSFVPNPPAGSSWSGSMDPITVNFGEEIDKPVCGFTVEGYEFNGWKDRAGNTYNTDKLTFTEDVTLLAQWKARNCEVSFDVNGGSEVNPSTYGIDYGESLTLPESSKLGYTLQWKDDNGELFDPGTRYPVTGDVHFVAQWIANEHHVTYMLDGEVYGEVDTVAYGTQLTARPDAEKEGYTFSGWSGLPETMPDEDVVVTGSFTVNSYTLTYKVDGEVYGEVETVEYGAAVTPREAPSKEGYTFSGWSDIPETMPAHDVEVTGSFTVNSYTLTYKVDGEVYGEVETVEYGAAVTPREAPAKEGYTFSGWSDIPETMPANDVVIEGTFNVNKYSIRWLNHDGSLIVGENLDYGTMPEYPGQDDPIKGAGDNEDGVYNFVGWTPDLVSVTGDADYTATFTFTGWRSDANGKRYFVNDEMQKGWLELDSGKYYLDPDTGYAAVGVVQIGEDDPGHAFDANGVWQENVSGVFTDSRTEDVYLIGSGIVEVFPGLYMTENHEYYYFGEDNKAIRGEIKWVEKNHADPDNVADRGMLPKWDYDFGDDGIIKHEDVSINGIHESDGVLYYYIDGIRVHYGMFMQDGYYYYANRNGKLITDRTYWCTDNYGLMDEGSYPFDAQGRMIMPDTEKNGILEEDGSLWYYVDGVRTYAGLIEIDGSYYYVKTSGEVVHGQKYWITKTNGVMQEKAYTFDEHGRMVMPKNGILEEDGSLWYYVDGVRTYAGVFEYEGAYYYAKTNGEVVHGRSYWITKTNGVVPEKSYVFENDGKMVLDVPIGGEGKNGIVDEAGSKWYYVDGKLTYAGLILIDGDYYYVKTNGEVVHGRTYWITKTNGLLQEKAYTFDDSGKLVNP